MSANDWADLEAGEVDYWVAKTPANVSEKLYANQALGGVGQSWHDVTASRDSAVTFTNSTGRPIFLSAIIEATSTNNYQQRSMQCLYRWGYGCTAKGYSRWFREFNYSDDHNHSRRQQL